MKRYKRKNLNTKKYWDKIYSKKDEGEQIDEFKFNFIEKFVINGSKVIDLGCGNGRLVDIIRQGNPDCEVIGLDFSDNAGDITASIYDTGLENDSFDYVLSTEVLEHLEEPDKMIMEASRILKPNGKFLMTTPYKDHIPSMEHLWEFDYQDIELMMFKWFRRYWVFPFASGRYRFEDDGTITYPPSNMDTIFAIAEK